MIQRIKTRYLILFFLFLPYPFLEAGKTWLNENWKLCNPIKTITDLNTLKDWLSNVFVNMAMINYPYPTNFLMPVPGNPVAVSF